jgi:hydrogenase maturation protease
MSCQHERRIICAGNRYVPQDDIGPRVFDCLSRRDLPADVCVIDGGLMGLDLLRFVEGARRVVFVDALQGFAPPDLTVVLGHRAALEERPAAYGHDGGLACLLRMLPAVCGEALPEIALVGSEPPAGEDLIEKLADLSLRIAMGAVVQETRS